jgi:hypothetical protein
MNNAEWLRDAILAQFGSEIKAGKHHEYPALRRMWLVAETERAEQAALEQACFEVFNRADRNWLEN